MNTLYANWFYIENFIKVLRQTNDKNRKMLQQKMSLTKVNFKTGTGATDVSFWSVFSVMGLFPETSNCGLCMHLEFCERFPRHRYQRKPLVSDNARAVMHVGMANPQWRGKRSRHSRRMRNPQFNVSGKGSIVAQMSSGNDMKMPSHGSAFRITVPLVGESNCDRWTLITKNHWRHDAIMTIGDVLADTKVGCDHGIIL